MVSSFQLLVSDLVLAVVVVVVVVVFVAVVFATEIGSSRMLSWLSRRGLHLSSESSCILQ